MKEKKAERKIVEGGKYKHYKGNFYKVHFVVRHSETLEYLVCYEALYENKDGMYWVRPLKMFLEDVVIDGKKMNRFEYVGTMKSEDCWCEDCRCEDCDCEDSDHNCGHCKNCEC